MPGLRQVGWPSDRDAARRTAPGGRRSCAGASSCRRRSGRAGPVTPGAEREADVVDGDDVAVPARDVRRRARWRAGAAAATARRSCRDDRGSGAARTSSEPATQATAAARYGSPLRSAARTATFVGSYAEEPGVDAVEDVGRAEQHGDLAEQRPVAESARASRPTMLGMRKMAMMADRGVGAPRRERRDRQAAIAPTSVTMMSACAEDGRQAPEPRRRRRRR